MIADKPFTDYHIYNLRNHIDNNLADCHLIQSFNTTIKSIDKRDRVEYYIWCSVNKLWKKNCDNALKHEIVRIFQTIATRASQQDLISETQRDVLIKKTLHHRWFLNIIFFFHVTPDPAFETQLNIMHPYLPISNGKKINMKTLEISERKKTDYWSFHFGHQFIRKQPTDNNKFAQFLKRLFPDFNEYEYMVKMLGSMIIAAGKNNTSFLLDGDATVHKAISLLMNLLEKVFPQVSYGIQDKANMHRKITIRNKTFFSKLKNKRFIWIDNISAETNLSVILKLVSGTTSLYHQASNPNMSRSLVKPTIIILGNQHASQKKFSHLASNKHLVVLKMKLSSSSLQNIKLPTELHDSEFDNHIFTFMVCAANYYLASNFDLFVDQPKKWKRVWAKKILMIDNFLNDTFIRGDPKNNFVYVSTFKNELINYTTIHYNYDTKIEDEIIENCIRSKASEGIYYSGNHDELIMGISFTKAKYILFKALNNNPQI